MRAKMAIAFAFIFMAHIEKQLLTCYKPHKPFLWKRYIDDIFCAKPKSTTSLILLSHSTLLLDSRTKCHQKNIFSILTFLKDRDLPLAKSLMFKRITSRQKRSNIHTSLHSTFSVLRKVFSNERQYAYWEQTLFMNLLSERRKNF